MLKIDKGFGRTILVDLEQPSKNLVAIGFEVENPAIAYRAMPHGQFAVRILTPEPTEVEIQLDGETLLETELEPGVHSVRQMKDGTPFVFVREGAVRPQRAALTDAKLAEVTVADDKEKSPEEKPKRFLAPSHGLVVVSLRIKHTKPANAPELPPDQFVHLMFQMNPTQEHFKAYAVNMDRVVAPEVPKDGHGLTDENGKPLNIHVPHFGCGFRH